MSETPPAELPAGKKRGAKLGLAQVIAVAAIVWAIWYLDHSIGAGGWKAVGERLAGAHLGWAALAAVCNLSVFSVWALRWRVLLMPVTRVSWWSALRALMASVFINTVVPFARSMGGLVRSAYLGRARGESIAAIYGPTLIDQIGYSTVSVSLGALCVPFAVWGGGSGRGRTTIALIAAGAVLAAVLVILRRRPGAILDWVRRRSPGAARSVESAVGSARTVLARPATWTTIVAGGAGVWVLNVATFWFAGRAIGAGFGFGAAAAAWSIGSMAGVASGTPGGVGTTESAAMLPLVQAGVAAPEALAAVLLARLIQYASALVIGGLCLLTGPSIRAEVALENPELDESGPATGALEEADGADLDGPQHAPDLPPAA